MPKTSLSSFFMINDRNLLAVILDRKDNNTWLIHDFWKRKNSFVI